MTIVVSDDVPVYQRARCLSEAEAKVVDEQIREWLQDNIIRPSLSPYTSPIVITKKKDGSIRLCIDYRQIN